MIVELLQSAKSAKELSEEYKAQDGVIQRWRRKCEARSGDLSKKRGLSADEI
jgi:hypothetical protein